MSNALTHLHTLVALSARLMVAVQSVYAVLVWHHATREISTQFGIKLHARSQQFGIKLHARSQHSLETKASFIANKATSTINTQTTNRCELCHRETIG